MKNATKAKYELKIDGVGQDGTKRTCTYYLIKGQEKGDNKSNAKKWGKAGSDLLNDGYRCYDAYTWFNIAVGLDENNSLNLEGIADSLVGLGNNVSAIKYANRSLNNLRYQNGSYYDEDKTKIIAYDYEIIGVAHINFGDTNKTKGDYKNATKNYKEAIKCLNTATDLYQDYFWALYHKGYTYSQMGNCTEAADSYKNATKAAENASKKAKEKNNKKNLDQAKEQLAMANDAYAELNCTK
jgi:tetratricopeptide (TPR) repeat protein